MATLREKIETLESHYYTQDRLAQAVAPKLKRFTSQLRNMKAGRLERVGKKWLPEVDKLYEEVMQDACEFSHRKVTRPKTAQKIFDREREKIKQEFSEISVRKGTEYLHPETEKRGKKGFAKFRPDTGALGELYNFYATVKCAAGGKFTYSGKVYKVGDSQFITIDLGFMKPSELNREDISLKTYEEMESFFEGEGLPMPEDIDMINIFRGKRIVGD